MSLHPEKTNPSFVTKKGMEGKSELNCWKIYIPLAMFDKNENCDASLAVMIGFFVIIKFSVEFV